MSNLSDVDISNVDATQNTYTPYPAGEYLMQVVSSERKTNKAGTGEYLEFQMDILDGEYMGRKYFERLNLWHPSENVRDIAMRQLKGLAMATGHATLKDSSDTHFVPFTAILRVSKRKDNGELQNNISFRSLGETAPRPAVHQSPTPAASAASGVKPWERNKKTA